MTVAYNAVTIPLDKITPTSWPAGEVVLVHSLLSHGAQLNYCRPFVFYGASTSSISIRASASE